MDGDSWDEWTAIVEAAQKMPRKAALNLARCWQWRAYWLLASADPDSLVVPFDPTALCASVPWSEPPQSEIHRQ